MLIDSNALLDTLENYLRKDETVNETHVHCSDKSCSLEVHHDYLAHNGKGRKKKGRKKKGRKKKGRKKKGKSKEKKQNSPRHDKQEKLVENIDDEEKQLLKVMGWKDGGTESMECFSSEEDLCISEQEILRFKANQSSVSQQRRKLREKLRQQFNNMTLKKGLNVAIVH